MSIELFTRRTLLVAGGAVAVSWVSGLAFPPRRRAWQQHLRCVAVPTIIFPTRRSWIALAAGASG